MLSVLSDDARRKVSSMGTVEEILIVTTKVFGAKTEAGETERAGSLKRGSCRKLLAESLRLEPLTETRSRDSQQTSAAETPTASRGGGFLSDDDLRRVTWKQHVADVEEDIRLDFAASSLSSS